MPKANTDFKIVSTTTNYYESFSGEMHYKVETVNIWIKSFEKGAFFFWLGEGWVDEVKIVGGNNDYKNDEIKWTAVTFIKSWRSERTTVNEVTNQKLMNGDQNKAM